ncbi:MAG TPA: ABC transporter ATP-binding protein [Spirochaetia bacterium]|nr:ABC transporter ATP-binding protein [Spirochaetia bacterium]
MARIELIGVEKTYPGSRLKAVEGLDLVIPEGSFVSLLGPSGCGKTTTLRMIAGLESPSAGVIRVGERVLFDAARGVDVPTEERGMGLVFQSYALWPHMTVADNVSFGLEMRKVPRPERKRRLERVFELLRLGGFEGRYPMQLSGGQQQRVALARMLVLDPEVLLLDEPLSNLDAKLRLEMRAELKRIHAELKNTIVFVTHDQLEGMTLSTEIAVMNRAVLQQFDKPMEVYRRPRNLFVAEFVGSPPINRIAVGEASCAEACGRLLELFPGLEGRARTIGVRPESISLSPRGGAGRAFRGRARVEAVLPTGSEWILSLELCGTPFFAISTEEFAGAPGDEIEVEIEAARLLLFDAEGERIEA